MPKTGDGVVMRRDWDERARKDALYYVATWRKDWTTEEFLESGEEEYLKLVQPVLHQASGFESELLHVHRKPRGLLLGPLS